MSAVSEDPQLQIAFPVRFHPVFVELKQVLDRGDLGRILSVECTNHGSMPGGWFIDSELSGGGAVIDHTVHVIDLLRWFWGAEVTEVFAEVGDSLVHPGLGIDDAGMLSFTLANGVYGTLDTSWSRPHPTRPGAMSRSKSSPKVAYSMPTCQSSTSASVQT